MARVPVWGGWSGTDHLTAHAVITWLVVHWSRVYPTVITWLRGADHVTVPSVIKQRDAAQSESSAARFRSWSMKRCPSPGKADHVCPSLPVQVLRAPACMSMPVQVHLCQLLDFLCMCAKSLQLYPTLCDLMDCSLLGSSVHGILQARILEWLTMASSRGSSHPRDRTQVSYISCIGRWVPYH